LIEAEERAEKAEERAKQAEARANSALAQNLELSAHLMELSAAKEQLTVTEQGLVRELELASARELELRRTVEQLTTELGAQKEELEAAHEWTSRALAQEKSLRDLAESLSQDLAAGANECAKLRHACLTAEAREQHALSRVDQAESNYSASQTELAELRERSAHLSVKNSLAREQLASADDGRVPLPEILSRIEALGDEIAAAGHEARMNAPQHERDPEQDRVTLVPVRAVDAASRRLRDSAAPEILIDGVKLSDVLT